MTPDQRRQLAGLALKQSKCHFDVPMAAYCTLRAGGRAAALAEVEDLSDLQKILRLCSTEAIKVLPLGRGSNILFADSGYSGLVLRPLVQEIQQQGEDSQRTVVVRVGAGLSLARFVTWSSREGLTGAEFLTGIPGSVGGALCMNAGAWGAEIGSLLKALEAVDGQGRLHDIPAEDLRPSYRRLAWTAGPLHDMVLTAAQVRLQAGNEEEIRRRCAAVLLQRKAKQPKGVASAGSFFKNPPGDFAGRLIEAAGLKGRRQGQAMISPVHANFLVNIGGATATDLIALMHLVQQVVFERFGVHLEPEVRIVQD
jgi:UDP-N-acetylmuramate dehydrogenase